MGCQKPEYRKFQIWAQNMTNRENGETPKRSTIRVWQKCDYCLERNALSKNSRFNYWYGFHESKNSHWFCLFEQSIICKGTFVAFGKADPWSKNRGLIRIEACIQSVLDSPNWRCGWCWSPAQPGSTIPMVASWMNTVLLAQTAVIWLLCLRRDCSGTYLLDLLSQNILLKDVSSNMS
jgi:hypothetical protein